MDTLTRRNKNTSWSTFLLEAVGGVRHGIVPSIETTFQRLEQGAAKFAAGGEFDLLDPDEDAAILHAEFKYEFDGWISAVQTRAPVPVDEFGMMNVIEVFSFGVALLRQINEQSGGMLGLSQAASADTAEEEDN